MDITVVVFTKNKFLSYYIEKWKIDKHFITTVS